MPYKDKEKNLEYQREYQKKWREENPERIREIRNKSEARPERKEYQKKWQRESPKFKIIRKRFQKSEKSKQYQKEWEKNNPEKLKNKYKKYALSVKGIVTILRRCDKAKFGIINEEINIALINFVNERDKECPYCGGEFEPRVEYDHINPFRSLSVKNIAKACSKCNQSKLNSDLLQWMKFKGYEITNKIRKMYEEAYK